MKRRGSAAAGRAKKRQTRSSRAESVEVKPEPQEKEEQEPEPPTRHEPAEPAGAGQAVAAGLAPGTAGEKQHAVRATEAESAAAAGEPNVEPFHVMIAADSAFVALGHGRAAEFAAPNDQ